MSPEDRKQSQGLRKEIFCERLVYGRERERSDICAHKHSLICIEIGMYTIFWLLDSVSSSFYGCEMFTFLLVTYSAL